MWDLDVVTVVAAGHSGNIGGSLDLTLPQKLGTAANGLITVGGVFRDGVLDDLSTFDRGRGGSITVYAVSQAVRVADYSVNVRSRMSAPGTSVAAPAVAGLAAYFASLDSLNNEWQRDHVATDMKNYIQTQAYRRSANPIPANLVGGYRAPSPNSIFVAYNGAPEGLCSAHLPGDVGSQAREEPNFVKRQNSIGGDFDVVVSGTMVVSSLSQSYCYNTSFPTLTRTSTTTTNSASITTSTASSSPTVHVDQGILTCGTRTDQGNAKYFFTLGDMTHARDQLCANLTTAKAVFKPGADTNKAGTYDPPDNVDNFIWVSAKWNNVDDSGCPTLDFSKNVKGAAYKLCQDRFGIPIQDCKSSTTFDLI